MGIVSSLLCAGILILTGLDLKWSTTAWVQGIADLNPIIQFGVKNYGLIGGGAALIGLNLCLLVILSTLGPVALGVFFGGKLTLAAIQLRSKLIKNEYSNAQQPKLRK